MVASAFHFPCHFFVAFYPFYSTVLSQFTLDSLHFDFPLSSFVEAYDTETLFCLISSRCPLQLVRHTPTRIALLYLRCSILLLGTYAKCFRQRRLHPSSIIQLFRVSHRTSAHFRQTAHGTRPVSGHYNITSPNACDFRLLPEPRWLVGRTIINLTVAILHVDLATLSPETEVTTRKHSHAATRTANLTGSPPPPLKAMVS